MKRRYVLFSILFIFYSFTQAQLEGNTWYFGNQAGISFASGNAVAIGGGQTDSWEAAASVSDIAGNLLFYTDGVSIWNKNHALMPGGSATLLGSNSATQIAIVQKPGSDSEYYIFTTPSTGGSNGLRYTEVDMSLDNGLGDVTANLNILLWSSTTEKVTSTLHCNRKDVWVVSHDFNSNQFRSFLITSTGVDTASPVITSIGVSHSGHSFKSVGAMKISPDGSRLACAVYGSITSIGFFELYDFDNSTGIISNRISLLSGSYGYYGTEFSPDGSKLYVILNGLNLFYQFDLCAVGNPAITLTHDATTQGAMQLGPDGKIYVARVLDNSLGVINNPNAVGNACNYVDNGISLGTNISQRGLCNYTQSQQVSQFTVVLDNSSTSCLKADFTSPTVNLTSCSSSSSAIVSVSWNFNDPASGVNNSSVMNNPTHVFSGSGTYNVELILYYGCGIDTLNQEVEVTGLAVTSTQNNILCAGENTGNATIFPVGGAAPFNYLWTYNGGTSPSATNLTAATYDVLVTDSNGCQSTIILTITEPLELTSQITFTNATCDENNGTATAEANGGTGIITYLWDDPQNQTSPQITGLTNTTYTVTIEDANGCTTTETATIIMATNNPVVTAWPDATINQGESVQVNSTGGDNCLWIPGAGLSSSTECNPIAMPSQTTTYIVEVTDSNGCKNSDTITIIVEENEFSIYIPNAFSPNDDGTNDIFNINGIGVDEYLLQIFNRWGEMVFESNDITASWDGTAYGKGQVQQDVYFYSLEASAKSAEQVRYAGNVAVVR